MNLINLFGGPGTGKSTTAAGTFHLMKLAGRKVELVTEYAKDLVWDDRSTEDQIQILGEQYHRFHRLRKKVDFIVTDSPMFLSVVYGKLYMPQYKHFLPFVNELVQSFDNINVFLNRVKGYEPAGRNQTEAEAKDLDATIKTMLWEYSVPVNFSCDGDVAAPQKIVDFIKEAELP